MSLIVNGTTIPTNVANSLILNGTSITSVIFNGINVWTQQLNTALTWSGSSYAPTYPFGINTSGNTWRSRAEGMTYYGPWQTVNTNGTFSGDSIITVYREGIKVSGSLMRPYKSGENLNFTWMTYNVASHSFTGTGFSAYYDGYNGILESLYFTTSGGLMRTSLSVNKQTYASTSWISLS